MDFMFATGRALPEFSTDYGKVKRNYGWIIYIKYYCIILIFVYTLLQCSGVLGEHDYEWHFSENNESGVSRVTVTYSPGIIGIDASEPDVNGLSLVTSHSNVNVDAIVIDKHGNKLFSVEDIPPEGFFWLDTEQSHQVTVTAG
jgi:hypothetical protein